MTASPPAAVTASAMAWSPAATMTGPAFAWTARRQTWTIMGLPAIMARGLLGRRVALRRAGMTIRAGMVGVASGLQPRGGRREVRAGHITGLRPLFQEVMTRVRSARGLPGERSWGVDSY